MSIDIGDVFTRLTVIAKADDRVSPNGHVRKYWLCKCSCDRNKTVEVRTDGLKSGKVRSCGCLRDETASLMRKGKPPVKVRSLPSLVGQVFGRLMVVAPAERTVTPKGRDLPRWICSCKCGNDNFIALHDSLKAGDAVSCGCVPPEFVDSDFKNKSEVFAFKAKEVHGEKYDYSLVDFKRSDRKVTIVCPEHGAFEQTPSNHLCGRCCPKCSWEERAEKQHWNYLKQCKLDESLANSDAAFYLLKLNDDTECFLKVGISVSFKKRLSSYKKEGLNFEVLQVVNTTAIKAAIFEREALKYIRENSIRYIPNKMFGGWTECATLESKDQLVKLFEGYTNNE